MIFKFKVIIVGDAAVGKTSLIRHYCDGYFKDTYRSTIGVSFLKKTLNLDHNGEHKVTLQLWDVGGQALFSSVRPNYYRGAHGALILFDVTNSQSLSHVFTWYQDLSKTINDIPMVMIGNKIDLDYNREKIEKQALTLSDRLNIELYYTSAKTGTHMNEVFAAITRNMIDHIEKR
ncbi:MAG: Rab family GTPase [Promethearchaeota archaeon]